MDSESAVQRSQSGQAQKIMVFILAMALFGLSDLVTEILPELEFGPIDIGVSYFGFIPIALAILLDPLYAALGACTGEIIFADLLMGDFGGIGEIEGFIQLAIGLYIAGLLVKDATNTRQVGIAALVGVGIDQFLSSVVDIGKVWVGIESIEAVPGLPESIVVLEGVSFLNEMVITGVIFTALPAMWLVPRLYGKIEPLMGVQPQEQKGIVRSIWEAVPGRTWLYGFLFAVVALVVEFMAESGIEWAVWEPDFVDQFGD
jgi:hypothetical protein